MKLVETFFLTFRLVILLKVLPLVFPLTILTSAVQASTAETSMTTEQLVERERRRLEEVFIWKMSEELRLSVEIEATFAEAIRALNREKHSANSEVSQSLAALGKSKSPKDRDLALKRYERAWRNYGELPIREVSRMRPILGSEKLGQYLVAKSQMAERLKALSTNSQPNTLVKPPAVEAATPGAK